jgi:thioredoxin-dependent peroxiredoxin
MNDLLTAEDIMQIGDTLPDLTLPATNNQMINLANLAGHPVLLYFYPRDDTPGCTLEGENFRDHFAQFQAKHVQIFGVSRDSVKSHEKFKLKYSFPFELLSDEAEIACQLFGVMRDKVMFGKQVRGIERSSFLFDSRGILCEAWHKVKVEQHLQEILSALKVL